jgi:YggT family protein
MRTFWLSVDFVILAYWLLVIFRLVIETARTFARSWWPTGAAAIGVEIVYSSTDPPIKLLRRLVPPLRIGATSLDLSVLIVLLVLFAIRSYLVLPLA